MSLLPWFNRQPKQHVEAGDWRAHCQYLYYHLRHKPAILSNNDLVALDWIENEYCKTGRSKWDGVILQVIDKKTSPVLVELSGGSKVNATMNKEAHDISKLYSNIISIIADLPDNIFKTMFSARFYGIWIKTTTTSQYNTDTYLYILQHC